jgi:hypothetical protein
MAWCSFFVGRCDDAEFLRWKPESVTLLSYPDTSVIIYTRTKPPCYKEAWAQPTPTDAAERIIQRDVALGFVRRQHPPAWALPLTAFDAEDPASAYELEALTYSGPFSWPRNSQAITPGQPEAVRTGLALWRSAMLIIPSIMLALIVAAVTRELDLLPIRLKRHARRQAVRIQRRTRSA